MNESEAGAGGCSDEHAIAGSEQPCSPLPPGRASQPQGKAARGIRARRGLEAATTIDPRSFHIFRIDGTDLLFDRSTASVSEVDPIAAEVFRNLEGGTPLVEALSQVSKTVPGIQVSELQVALMALRARGFFQYSPIKQEEQTRMLDIFLNHPPYRAQLLVSQKCNLACRYCYAWRNGANALQALMSWDVAKAAVDYLIRTSAGRPSLHITFFGGEPLLNYPIIQQVVRYCSEVLPLVKKTVTFELVTNGTLLTREVVDFLVANRFLLFVSIDGPRAMHNYNRPALNGEDLYDTILRNALYANEQYKAHGLVPVKARANLTADHCDYFGVGAFLAKLGFQVIGVGTINQPNHGPVVPGAILDSQADYLQATTNAVITESAKRLARGESVDYFTRLQFRKSMLQFGFQTTQGITCGVCRNTQAIDTQGRIFPCHRYEGMTNFVVGNVLSGGLYKHLVWRYYCEANQRAIRRCENCWIRDYCAGGCIWSLSKEDGSFVEPLAVDCERRRQSMERTLWLRYYLSKHAPQLLPTQERERTAQWSWEAAQCFNQAEALQTEHCGSSQSPYGSSCD